MRFSIAMITALVGICCSINFGQNLPAKYKLEIRNTLNVPIRFKCVGAGEGVIWEPQLVAKTGTLTPHDDRDLFEGERVFIVWDENGKVLAYEARELKTNMVVAVESWNGKWRLNFGAGSGNPIETQRGQ